MDPSPLSRQLLAWAMQGRALIVGGVHPSGSPHATRGWGLRRDGEALVVVLDADDDDGAACLVPGARIAVSAADVRTFRSLQLKGSVGSVGAADATDLDTVQRYLTRFYDALVEVDGLRREVVERITPSRYAACRFHLSEAFDQTPGAGAGAAVVAW